MEDQAEKLRELMKQQQGEIVDFPEKKVSPRNKTRIICIASGKGGVGKTNISVNLAIGYARLGKKVVILECTDDLFYAILPQAHRPSLRESETVGIKIGGETIHLSGRLDANGVEQVRETFLNWEGPMTLDLAKLDYISSAGLGLLLMILKKQKKSSYEMRLANLKPDVRNVLIITGYDKLFQL